jgi:Fe-S-cluster containining protein
VDPSERPQLRPDLELILDQTEEPAGVLVYDPVRRGLFELDAADLPVLRLLDGTLTPQEIARQAQRSLDEVLDLNDDLSDLLLLVDPEQEELLIAWRRDHEAADRLLQPILDCRPAAEVAVRPVHVVDDARHACRRCGACCYYTVPVSPEERRRLEEVAWPAEVIPPEAGRLFQVRPGVQWGRLETTIATRSGPTRCAFLDEKNLCRIQECMGPVGKPFPCRLFPLAYPVLTPTQVIFSLTFECPYLFETYDSGPRLAGRAEDLAELVAMMDEVYALPETIPLGGAGALPLADYLAWEKVLLAGPPSPATAPETFLAHLQQQWVQVVPQGPAPVPTAEELATLARSLAASARENRTALADCPEGEEGSGWAVRVLEDLAAHPEEAGGPVPWEDRAGADRFLSRFVRHFVEGKQMLLYRTLWTGLHALAVILLLARRDAALLAREAGQPAVSQATLNRALARWCRLLDIRPLRLAFLRRYDGPSRT